MAVIETRFGESEPLSLGVEEELMILDAASYAQVPSVRTLLAEVEGRELPGTLKTELFASVVELNTHRSASADEALASLKALRRTAADAAGRHGLRVAAAGSHPFSRPEDQEIADEPRYRDFVAYAGVSASRQGVQGLHVHVGMPDGDTCLNVLETVLPWLPVVLALSANSPYLAGAETGLASNRAEVLAQLPRSGAPPRFESFAHWERFVNRFTSLGVAPDYTALWWDVRAHPRFGTLELRVPDQPTGVELSGAFVALLQALCAWALDRPAPTNQPGERAVYQQNRWAAARFGPRARLIHPNGDRVAGVAELAAELVGLVGPFADGLGSAALVAALDPSSCEGDRQLEVARAHGLPAVCADVVDRSLASP